MLNRFITEEEKEQESWCAVSNGSSARSLVITILRCVTTKSRRSSANSECQFGFAKERKREREVTRITVLGSLTGGSYPSHLQNVPPPLRTLSVNNTITNSLT